MGSAIALKLGNEARSVLAGVRSGALSWKEIRRLLSIASKLRVLSREELEDEPPPGDRDPAEFVETCWRLRSDIIAVSDALVSSELLSPSRSGTLKAVLAQGSLRIILDNLDSLLDIADTIEASFDPRTKAAFDEAEIQHSAGQSVDFDSIR